jgi:hypothetical protein
MAALSAGLLAGLAGGLADLAQANALEQCAAQAKLVLAALLGS